MQTNVRYLGLDVHKDSIVIAVSDRPGDAAVLATIPHDHHALLKRLRALQAGGSLEVCYEAGPTGFGLQRFLTEQQIACCVVAPSLIPVRTGTRIKTDRRDACTLARFLRSGELTAVHVPDAQTEAIRDLERTREDARIAERTARQHLLKFLLRHDRKFTGGKSHWTQTHWRWIRSQTFEQPALNAVLEDYIHTATQASERVRRLTALIAEHVQIWILKPLVENLQAFLGAQLITATAVTAEVAHFARFRTARAFMGYTGLVPSEYSSGGSRKQGTITKTGNRHLRRLLIEAAWHYYSARPGVSAALQKRRHPVPPEIVAIAEKARLRLAGKARRMRASGKRPNKIVTALARELAGFLWAAAVATTSSRTLTA